MVTLSNDRDMTLAYWVFSRFAHFINIIIKVYMNTQQTQALFIGVDVHKDTHTAVGISPFGKKVFEMKIGNYESDFKMLSEKADEIVYIPKTTEALSPILAVIPLQLLAYYIAVKRGCHVDQPRNLAKSVTVE